MAPFLEARGLLKAGTGRYRLESAYGEGPASPEANSKHHTDANRQYKDPTASWLHPLVWLAATLALAWATAGQWVVWMPFFMVRSEAVSQAAVEELDLVSDFFDYTVSEDIENATHNMHGMQDMHGMHDMEIEMEMGEMYMKAGVDAKYLRAPAHLALVALVYHLPFFVLGLAGWFTRYWHNNNPTRAILVIFSSIYHLTLSFMMKHWNERIRAVFNRSAPKLPWMKGEGNKGVTYVEVLVLMLILAPKVVYFCWFISASQAVWQAQSHGEYGTPKHYSQAQFWVERIGLWTGTDFLITAPFLFAFVARGSLVNSYLGVGFGTIVKWHRWVGTISICDILVHGLMYQAVWISDSFSGWHMRQFRFQYNAGVSSLSAFISWSSCIVLLITLRPIVRRTAYWVFYWSHVIASAVFVIFGMIHTHKVWKYFSAGLVLYGIDVAYRWLQASHDVTVFVTPGSSLTSVVIPVEEGLDYGDGGHLWIRLPELGGKLGRQYHPFGVASSSADPAWRSCMLLHCKQYSRWTKKLLQGLKSGELPQRMRAHVQGPFDFTVASGTEMKTFQHLLIGSGGIGIATVLPMLKRMALQIEREIEKGDYNAGDWPVATLYHTARTLDELALIAPLLPHTHLFTLHLHLTQPLTTALTHAEEDPSYAVVHVPVTATGTSEVATSVPLATSAALLTVKGDTVGLNTEDGEDMHKGTADANTAHISISIPLPMPPDKHYDEALCPEDEGNMNNTLVDGVKIKGKLRKSASMPSFYQRPKDVINPLFANTSIDTLPRSSVPWSAVPTGGNLPRAFTSIELGLPSSSSVPRQHPRFEEQARLEHNAAGQKTPMHPGMSNRGAHGGSVEVLSVEVASPAVSMLEGPEATLFVPSASYLPGEQPTVSYLTRDELEEGAGVSGLGDAGSFHEQHPCLSRLENQAMHEPHAYRAHHYPVAVAPCEGDIARHAMHERQASGSHSPAGERHNDSRGMHGVHASNARRTSISPIPHQRRHHVMHDSHAPGPHCDSVEWETAAANRRVMRDPHASRTHLTHSERQRRKQRAQTHGTHASKARAVAEAPRRQNRFSQRSSTSNVNSNPVTVTSGSLNPSQAALMGAPRSYACGHDVTQHDDSDADSDDFTFDFGSRDIMQKNDGTTAGTSTTSNILLAAQDMNSNTQLLPSNELSGTNLLATLDNGCPIERLHLSKSLYVAEDAVGYSRPLSDTREKKKPCTQLQDSSSFIMEAEAGCQDVKRAKGSSHKWESLFVWIGAWASSFWCLALGDIHLQRLRGGAEGYLSESALNMFKQSRAGIQVLACMLTVFVFPMCTILTWRVIRAVNHKLDRNRKRNPSDVGETRESSISTSDDDVFVHKEERLAPIGQVRDASEFWASSYFNRRDSGTRANAWGPHHRLERAPSDESNQGQNQMSRVGTHQLRTQGKDFEISPQTIGAQSNQKLVPSKSSCNSSIRETEKCTGSDQKIHEGSQMAFMCLREVLLDVINGQIQMRLPGSDAPPVLVKQGRPDLAAAVRTVYHDSMKSSNAHIDSILSSSSFFDELGKQRTVSGSNRPVPFNIWAAGPKRMNDVLYEAARILPLTAHVGVFPMAYEL